MNNVQGAFFSYKDFRQSLDRQPIKPRVWRCSELGDMRQTLEASDVDIVALAHDNTLEGCQLTPGMAVSMQWLVPAWTRHGFVNTSTTEALAMLNLSNMPHMALLSNHADNVGLIPRPL